MKKQPKILVLTTTFPRWRGDTDPPFVFELCRRLAKDFDITVLAPHFPGSAFAEYLGGIGVVPFRYSFGTLRKVGIMAVKKIIGARTGCEAEVVTRGQ